MTQVFYRSESASCLSHTIGLGSAPKSESFSSKPPANYSKHQAHTANCFTRWRTDACNGS
jgi:hypothetical protein